MLVLVGLSTPAWAQMPGGGMPGSMPGMSFGLPSANTRYVVADVASKRFPGEDVIGPTFSAGEQVDVILEEGDRVRIRQGERYGWVSAAQLTTVGPAQNTMPLIPSMPSMPGGNPLLGGLKPLSPAPPAPPAPKTP